MIKRYTLYTSGIKTGELEEVLLSSSSRSTEFPTYNYKYATKPYCYYYAVEWWHDDVNMGSMAIVKRNICSQDATLNTVYWYEPGNFPSEPTFIPRANASDEDDGVIVFTLLNGKENKGNFMIVDAKTMLTLEKVELPTSITFTAHGQFFSSQT